MALMGIQAVKGVEVGDGFDLARRRGTEAHDEIDPGLTRRTNRAGGLEAGMTNGEPVIVRAEKSEMAVTVGADGFSYTRKDEDGHPGEKTGFKLGAQL